MDTLDNSLQAELKKLQHAYKVNSHILDRLNKWCEAESGFDLDTLQLIQDELQQKMSDIVEVLSDNEEYHMMIDAYR